MSSYQRQKLRADQAEKLAFDRLQDIYEILSDNKDLIGKYKYLQRYKTDKRFNELFNKEATKTGEVFKIKPKIIEYIFKDNIWIERRD